MTGLNKSTHCQVCQAPVPGDAPEGFCPTCELRGALHCSEATDFSESEAAAEATAPAFGAGESGRG